MRSDMRIYPAILLASLLVACSGAPVDIGAQPEGKLLDRGSGFVVGRYSMNLGAVNLGEAQERYFRVEGLPGSREFVLGIQIQAGDCAIQKSDLRVALKMTDERGRMVIDEEHPLREFVWSAGRDYCVPAFGYIRGRAEEVRVNDRGDVCMRPVITGADGGRGTYFVTREGAVYRVTVKVRGRPAGTLDVRWANVTVEDNGAKQAGSWCPTIEAPPQPRPPSRLR